MEVWIVYHNVTGSSLSIAPNVEAFVFAASRGFNLRKVSSGDTNAMLNAVAVDKNDFLINKYKTMKTLMIEKMNEEKQMYENIKSLFTPYMTNEIADAKTNEVMRITSHSFGELSADDICPYCTELRNQDGVCQCSNVR